MVRTLTLVFGFAWFANQSARFGDTILAANHMLLQLIAFSAFFLDGYAFVLESFVGRAVGSDQRTLLRKAIRYSSELALATALLLAAAIFGFGEFAIVALTDIGAVKEAAFDFLPWCALYVLVAVGAFQLDGVFIGATKTRDMRNASLLSLVVFMLLWWLALPFGNQGLWWAFIGFVLARFVSLLIFYPRVEASLS